MTIGTGTYAPMGKFTFTRAYVGAVAFSVDWDLETHILHQFVFNDFRFYNDRLFIGFLPEFWTWNSNRYTLDYAVEESYFHALPSTVQNPLNFTLTFKPATPTHPATLAFTNTFFSPVLQYFPLPPADVPYWLP